MHPDLPRHVLGRAKGRVWRKIAYALTLASGLAGGTQLGCAPWQARRPVPPSGHLIAPPAAASASPLNHLLAGLYLLHAENPERGIPRLRAARAAAFDSPFVHEKLAAAMLAAGEQGDAADVLEVGLRAHPDDPGLNLLGGQLDLDAGRYPQAVTRLSRAVADPQVLPAAAALYVDALAWHGAPDVGRVADGLMARRPADTEMCVELGNVLEDHGELGAATAAYQRARAQQPAHRAAALGMLRLALLAGDPSRAVAAIEPLAAIYPDEPQIAILLTHLLREAGRPQDAAARRREALRSADAEGVLELARTDALDGEPALAVQLLVQANPDDVASCLLRAELTLEERQPEAALRILADLPASPERLELQALAQAAVAPTEVLLETLLALARVSPDPGQGLAHAAALLAPRLSPAAVAATLESMLAALRPGFSPAGVLLAQTGVAEAQEQGEVALSLLDTLATLHPDDDRLLLRRADLRARLGAVDEALAALTAMVRHKPHDPARLNALGFTLVEAGVRLPEAAVWLRRALRFAPDDGAILDSYGWLLVRQGRPADAVRWLVRAHAALWDDPQILLHLGDALTATGARARAKEAYMEAARLYPNAPLRRLLRARLQTF